MEHCNQKMTLIEGDYGKKFPNDKQYFKCTKCAKEVKYERQITDGNHNEGRR